MTVIKTGLGKKKIAYGIALYAILLFNPVIGIAAVIGLFNLQSYRT